MNVLLAHDFLALHIKCHIELRQCRQRMSAGLEDKRQRCHFDAPLLTFSLETFAESFKIGEINIFMLRHVGHIQPTALHVVGRRDLHARHGVTLNVTKLTEVRQLDARDTRATGHCAATLCFLQLGLYVTFNVVLDNPALGPAALHPVEVRTQLSGQFAYSRASMYLGTRLRYIRHIIFARCRAFIRSAGALLAGRLISRFSVLGLCVVCIILLVAGIIPNLHFQQIIPFGQFVTFADQYFGDLASMGRRDFERGFV